MANMMPGITFHTIVPSESEGGPNPYKLGTAKRVIFQWCLKQTEGFSKQDFYDFVLQALEDGTIQSRMKTPETTAMAWFSELKNKEKCFRIEENLNI